MKYLQNETIELTSRYGFRIYEADHAGGRTSYTVGFTKVDQDLNWPINCAYTLTQDDLFRLYVFIGAMLGREYADHERTW